MGSGDWKGSSERCQREVEEMSIYVNGQIQVGKNLLLQRKTRKEDIINPWESCQKHELKCYCMKILPMANCNYDTPGLSVVTHRVFLPHKISPFYLLN